MKPQPPSLLPPVLAPGVDAPRPATVATRLGPVECVSTGEGPPVLSLHGAMGGWDQSLLLARTLGEAGYRYLAVSRPGYLGTPLSGGRSPEEQGDLLAALLDAMGVERAAVMAVSGGGYAALHFALRHPGRCAALVLVSTTAGPTPPPPLAFHLIRLLLRVPGFEQRARRRAERDPEGNARRAFRDAAQVERLLADAEAWGLYRELARTTSARMAERWAGTANDVRVTRTHEYPLERIAAPVLVVHGTRDPLVPFERHGAALAARIPGAKLLALEGGEHPAIFTHRPEARAAVTAFLRAHAHPASG
ncbi:MAG TPA: alpha/beta hydrolase [Anaeromyxobacteraceae bacterium]|nr:alpha/beta hydrolase [Anaeromyxobacteraceae bacterium]